jgi:hypothetical protein
MAVATKTKPRATTPAPAPEPEPKPETKEEPKAVADQRLGKILKDYTSAEKTTGSYWLKIVQYCKEAEVSREVLMATLIQYRGIQKNTASVEATLILAGTREEFSEALDEALEGKKTAREFRKMLMKPRDKKEPENIEKETIKQLKKVARFAIDNGFIEKAGDFRKLAFEVFTEVLENEYTSDDETGKPTKDETATAEATEEGEGEAEEPEAEE